MLLWVEFTNKTVETLEAGSEVNGRTCPLSTVSKIQTELFKPSLVLRTLARL